MVQNNKSLKDLGFTEQEIQQIKDVKQQEVSDGSSLAVHIIEVEAEALDDLELKELSETSLQRRQFEGVRKLTEWKSADASFMEAEEDEVINNEGNNPANQNYDFIQDIIDRAKQAQTEYENLVDAANSDGEITQAEKDDIDAKIQEYEGFKQDAQDAIDAQNPETQDDHDNLGDLQDQIDSLPNLDSVVVTPDPNPVQDQDYTAVQDKINEALGYKQEYENLVIAASSDGEITQAEKDDIDAKIAEYDQAKIDAQNLLDALPPVTANDIATAQNLQDQIDGLGALSSVDVALIADSDYSAVQDKINEALGFKAQFEAEHIEADEDYYIDDDERDTLNSLINSYNQAIQDAQNLLNGLPPFTANDFIATSQLQDDIDNLPSLEIDPHAFAFHTVMGGNYAGEDFGGDPKKSNLFFFAPEEDVEIDRSTPTFVFFDSNTDEETIEQTLMFANTGYLTETDNVFLMQEAADGSGINMLNVASIKGMTKADLLNLISNDFSLSDDSVFIPYQAGGVIDLAELGGYANNAEKIVTITKHNFTGEVINPEAERAKIALQQSFMLQGTKAYNMGTQGFNLLIFEEKTTYSNKETDITGGEGSDDFFLLSNMSVFNGIDENIIQTIIAKNPDLQWLEDDYYNLTEMAGLSPHFAQHISKFILDAYIASITDNFEDIKDNEDALKQAYINALLKNQETHKGEDDYSDMDGAPTHTKVKINPNGGKNTIISTDKIAILDFDAILQDNKPTEVLIHGHIEEANHQLIDINFMLLLYLLQEHGEELFLKESIQNFFIDTMQNIYGFLDGKEVSITGEWLEVKQEGYDNLIKIKLNDTTVGQMPFAIGQTFEALFGLDEAESILIGKLAVPALLSFSVLIGSSGLVDDVAYGGFIDEMIVGLMKDYIGDYPITNSFFMEQSLYADAWVQYFQELFNYHAPDEKVVTAVKFINRGGGLTDYLASGSSGDDLIYGDGLFLNITHGKINNKAEKLGLFVLSEDVKDLWGLDFTFIGGLDSNTKLDMLYFYAAVERITGNDISYEDIWNDLGGNAASIAQYQSLANDYNQLILDNIEIFKDMTNAEIESMLIDYINNHKDTTLGASEAFGLNGLLSEIWAGKGNDAIYLSEDGRTASNLYWKEGDEGTVGNPAHDTIYNFKFNNQNNDKHSTIILSGFLKPDFSGVLKPMDYDSSTMFNINDYLAADYDADGNFAIYINTNGELNGTDNANQIITIDSIQGLDYSKLEPDELLLLLIHRKQIEIHLEIGEDSSLNSLVEIQLEEHVVFEHQTLFYDAGKVSEIYGYNPSKLKINPSDDGAIFIPDIGGGDAQTTLPSQVNTYDMLKDYNRLASDLVFFIENSEEMLNPVLDENGNPTGLRKIDLVQQAILKAHDEMLASINFKDNPNTLKYGAAVTVIFSDGNGIHHSMNVGNAPYDQEIFPDSYNSFREAIEDITYFENLINNPMGGSFDSLAETWIPTLKDRSQKLNGAFDNSSDNLKLFKLIAISSGENEHLNSSEQDYLELNNILMNNKQNWLMENYTLSHNGLDNLFIIPGNTSSSKATYLDDINTTSANLSVRLNPPKPIKMSFRADLFGGKGDDIFFANGLNTDWLVWEGRTLPKYSGMSALYEYIEHHVANWNNLKTSEKEQELYNFVLSNKETFAENSLYSITGKEDGVLTPGIIYGGQGNDVIYDYAMIDLEQLRFLWLKGDQGTVDTPAIDTIYGGENGRFYLADFFDGNLDFSDFLSGLNNDVSVDFYDYVEGFLYIDVDVNNRSFTLYLNELGGLNGDDNATQIIEVKNHEGVIAASNEGKFDTQEESLEWFFTHKFGHHQHQESYVGFTPNRDLEYDYMQYV